MRKKFSATDVAQEIFCEPIPESKYEVLRSTTGEGYKCSLERPYMKGLKNFLEKETEPAHRLLFLTSDRKMARQGYLIYLKYCAFCPNAGEEEDSDYPFPAWEKDAQEKTEDVLLLSEQNMHPDRDREISSVEFIGFPFGGQNRETDRNAQLEGAENVLFELGVSSNAERIVKKILQLKNDFVAVWVRPAGDYEYFLRRLTFEGGYRVIPLEPMAKQDYLDCGRDYLSYHHFTADETAYTEMMDQLVRFRGEEMCEGDVYLHLDRCMCHAVKQGMRQLGKDELALNYDYQVKCVEEEWEKVIGLQTVKEELKRQVMAGSVLSDKASHLYSHIIMEGKPGTGKSKMARLYAKMRAEKGLSNGKFVDAVKADVVGRYVGQTAFLVRDLFQKADGGVLFLDEASFLLEDDTFVHEAVVELVRYMELYPQTTVIFATYPKEGRKLLECNPGFRSRISRVLAFPEYSEQQLWEIMGNMAKDYAFDLARDGKGEMKKYIDRIRSRSDFGNAREVRKLLETSIQEYGLRAGDAQDQRILNQEDIRKAAEYLLLQAGTEDASYGFTVEEGMHGKKCLGGTG